MKLLGDLFLQVASRCRDQIPELQIVLPAANAQRRQQIEQQLEQFPELPVKLLKGDSLTAMAAADAVLLASGTTALEAMLLKKPMVVSYRLGWFTHAIVSRLVKSPYVSLPNLLANKMLVPECLQKDATVERLTAELLPLLSETPEVASLRDTFHQLHLQLRQGGSEKAASALIEMLDDAK